MATEARWSSSGGARAELEPEEAERGDRRTVVRSRARRRDARLGRRREVGIERATLTLGAAWERGGDALRERERSAERELREKGREKERDLSF